MLLWYHTRLTFVNICVKMVEATECHHNAVAVNMKDIHPKYYPKAKITCACGKSFTVGSTVENIQVELCSACHPFYTGKQKLVDTARRVEKFRERLAKKEIEAAKRKGRKSKTEKRKAKRTEK